MCRLADELGFDEVSLPESRQHRAVFSMAAAALTSTRRVRVRIGIANPVTRHPAVLAMEAGTLAELGGAERLVLGVGAAEWTMRALGYEPPGWRPYTNVVETVRALRRWLDGEPLGFTPTTFPADAESRLDFVPPPRVRIDVGAVNGRMMEAAGEFTDGVQLGALVSAPYARWAVARLAAGAARAGRELTSLTVSSNVLVSVDADGTLARRAVREVIAYYLARVEGVVVDTSGADVDNVAAVRAAVRTEGVEAGAALGVGSGHRHVRSCGHGRGRDGWPPPLRRGGDRPAARLARLRSGPGACAPAPRRPRAHGADGLTGLTANSSGPGRREAALHTGEVELAACPEGALLLGPR